MIAQLALRLPPDIPVDPDAPHARDLLLRELSGPAYQAARPTWLDILSQHVQDWLGSLFNHPGGAGDVLAVIALVVIVCLVVGAIIVFGVPRRNRRVAAAARVFETGDTRTAAQLRAAAAAAERAGDWSAAVLDAFRALTVGLAERTIISVQPGTTSHEVTVAASSAFPAAAERLAEAAAIFDRVRYAGDSASPAELRAVREADDAVGSARPATPYSQQADSWHAAR
ncbi:MAG: DUF4129 domain-containing protein [Candidatus Dormiibacterota bacterium]